jgi:DNA processing protein
LAADVVHLSLILCTKCALLENELLYRLALTRIDGIGAAHAKSLLRHFGEAGAVFHAGLKELIRTGLPEPSARSICSFRDLASLEKECSLLDRQGIRSLFFTDKDYPQRLLPFANAPFVLFYRGNADLNASKILAIVGTRLPTEYGKLITEKLIRELAHPDILIVSGLAFGIDGVAHRAALKYGLPTVGVMGNGFPDIYPDKHAGLGKAMMDRGGLLTEFHYRVGSESYHFPLRNRIVAGMSDAIVVVETASEGGSMITAGKALEYGKKIFAVPGRLTDKRSAGCNELIARGQARLLMDAQQLKEDMKWESKVMQSTLFPSDPEPGLSETEKILIGLLREKENASGDELADRCRLDSSSIAMALLNLELKGRITALPGKRYRLSA